MSQYILLQSYLGASHYFYDVTSNGEPISRAKAMELGFVTKADFDRHKRSDYGPEWYIVNPGDRITVSILDDTQEEIFDETMVFIVPEAGLPNPPVSLDDERTGNNLHHYLMEHCKITHT